MASSTVIFAFPASSRTSSCKDPLGAMLGTEQTSASERPSSRARVRLFFFFYFRLSFLASSLTAYRIVFGNKRNPSKLRHKTKRVTITILPSPPSRLPSRHALGQHLPTQSCHHEPAARSLLSYFSPSSVLTSYLHHLIPITDTGDHHYYAKTFDTAER